MKYNFFFQKTVKTEKLEIKQKKDRGIEEKWSNKNRGKINKRNERMYMSDAKIYILICIPFPLFHF